MKKEIMASLIALSSLFPSAASAENEACQYLKGEKMTCEFVAAVDRQIGGGSPFNENTCSDKGAMTQAFLHGMYGHDGLCSNVMYRMAKAPKQKKAVLEQVKGKLSKDCPWLTVAAGCK